MVVNYGWYTVWNRGIQLYSVILCIFILCNVHLSLNCVFGKVVYKITVLHKTLLRGVWGDFKVKMERFSR
jgi:hypothetical protein